MVLFCTAREFDSLCGDIADKADVLRLQAKGGSMSPFIMSGDWVDVALCRGSARDIGQGDIVLFRKEGNLYLHRVLRKGPRGFLIKGDMSLGHDGIIPAGDILARVVSVQREGRRVDLRCPANRVISYLAAGSSFFLQYPSLFFRKARASGAFALSRIQCLKTYRRIVKKLALGKMVIRAAGPEDEERLRDLYLMSGHDVREGLARIKNEGYWLIAERKDRVAGALTMTRYEKDPGLYVIFGLEVKSVCRGMGVGRALVEAAISAAQDSGAGRIGLFVNKKAKPALALYRTAGFKEGGAVPPGFNCSGDDLYLSYDILSVRDPHSRLVQLLSQCSPGWDHILDRAVAEGVFYPLYRNAAIPTEVREKFKKIYYLHISRSCDFISRVEPVLECIESRKIPVLLFKGPAIDSLIYNDFMRPRLDLDITVRDEDMAVLEAALHDLGYTRRMEEKDYPIPEYLNSRLFTSAGGDRIPVHVHKHLINNMHLTVDQALSFDMKRVWGEAEAFKPYKYISVFKPEFNIVFLCEHGLKHGFCQLIYLYEIERLISYYGGRLDWSKFIGLAQEFGFCRQAYYGLYFVQEMLSLRVPQKVMDVLKPAALTRGERKFIKNTLRLKRSRYASFPVYIAMRRGVRKKTNFIFRTFFPPYFTLKGYVSRIRRLILP
ncbi:MAG: GNAT family N-acetyltransferase [Candidatus Omnitrophota bacterium]